MNTKGASLLIFAALIIIAAGLKAAEEMVVPFLLAAFIATIAATPVFWMEQRRVPSVLAISAVMLAMVLMLVGVGALVAQSVPEFTAKQDEYSQRLVILFEQPVSWLAEFGVPVSIDLALQYFDPGTALSLAGNTLRGLGSALSNGFLILLTTIFILSEASSFPRKLRDVLHDPERNVPHFYKFASDVNRYIAIKTTVSLATGLIVGVALVIIGVDFPVLWAVLAFLLNYVPTIGSIIAAVPPVLLALVQFGPSAALATAAVYVGVNLGMGNVIEPRFMGKELGLSTLIVFLSLVFWGWMFGPVGMLLSVPLTMTAKIALEANPGTGWLAHLLGPADALPEEEPDTTAPAADEHKAPATPVAADGDAATPPSATT